MKEQSSAFDRIQRLAAALVNTNSTEETRETIVEVCQSILEASAVCLYLLRPPGYYEMIAERGCTKEFKEQWLRLYPENVPLIAKHSFTEPLFFGSPDEFKNDFPNWDKLVENSKRKVIAYAPLIVNQAPIGLLGFSYNSTPGPLNKPFIMTVVNLCAQAIERSRLLELERVARQDAESANRAKTDFLTRISHEIRTPINAIKGFADLLARSEGLKANERNWTSRILKNASHLNELIGDVLDISKIEADKIDIYRHVFSLNEFIEDVKAVTGFKAEEKNIQLKFHSLKQNIEIHSDAMLLRQILINLVGNAIKFTPSGGKVEVKINYRDSKLRIEVTDSGVGIALENQKRIFEQYVKVEPATPSKAAGSGLGLFISKRLSMALGGDLVLLQSAPNQGSTFLTETSCNGFVVSENKPATCKFKKTMKLQGLSFLLVDDSIDNQVLLKCVLSREGALVDTADNGVAGVEKALKSDYQVIIMDIQMPELDGNEAVTRLRSNGYRKPIVALTAEALSNQRQMSLQRGFDEYLSKPIDSDLLISTLGRLSNIH